MPALRYQKRHLSDDGIWRVCRAQTRGCSYAQHRAGHEFSHLRAQVAGKTHAPKHASSAPLSFELLGSSIADWSPSAADGDLRVAPPGLSGKWCDSCGAYFTSLALAEVSSHDSLDCPNCEVEVRVNELPVDFCEDQLRFHDDKEVLAAHWFHISDREDWDAGTKKNEVVTHLGSKHAAMERMAQLIAQGSGSGKRFYLHEVVLREQVEVRPGIWKDQVGWPEEVGEFSSGEEALGVDHGQVLRYMNSYEGPGTVSLMADPNSYTLLTSVMIAAA